LGASGVHDDAAEVEDEREEQQQTAYPARLVEVG
jgi:hypothetical protein